MRSRSPFRRAVWWRLVLVAIALAALLRPSAASAHVPAAQQEAWRWTHFATDSGLPPGRVEHLTEADDGTPWVATDRQAAWYDGYRWHALAAPDSARIQQLAPVAGGRLVAIAGGRLFRLDRDGFESVPLPAASAQDRLTSVAPLGPDTLLVLADRGILRVTPTGVDSFPTPAPPAIGLLNRYPLRRTGAGRVWYSTGAGAFVLQGSRWSCQLAGEPYIHVSERPGRGGVGAVVGAGEQRGVWLFGAGRAQPQRLPQSAGDIAVSLGLAPDGAVAVLYESGQLVLWDGTSGPQAIDVPDPDANAGVVRFDAAGDLWLGGDDGVLVLRRSSRRWAYTAYPRGDARNRIDEILPTANGDVWLGTDGGLLVRHPDGAVTAIDSIGGQPLGMVTALAADASGAFWVGSGSGFTGAWRWDGRSWQRFERLGEAGAVWVHKIRADRRGRLWFLTISARPDLPSPGPVVLGAAGFEPWAPAVGLPNRRVYDLLETEDGALWFGTYAGLSRWRDGAWSHWGHDEGVREPVFALAAGDSGGVWLGHRGGGVGRLRGDDRLDYATGPEGDPRVQDLERDARGWLWVATQDGLLLFNGQAWSHFGMRQGLPAGSLWPLAVTRDRVYAGTTGAGLAVLDLPSLDVPPPIVSFSSPSFEGRNVLLRWAPWSWGGQEPSGEIPVRWRVDGGPWSPWGLERELHLDLAVGAHRLQVQAKGLLGQFAEEGSSETFQVPYPPFRHPGVLAVVAVLFLVSAGLALSRLRAFQRYEREREEAFERLRQAEERFRQVADHVSDILFVYEEQGQRPVYVSPAFDAVFGYPRERLFDGAHAWTDTVHPEDRAGLTAALAAGFGPGAQELAYRILRPDGQERWIAARAFAVRGESGPTGRVVGVARDVTEERRGERAARVRLALHGLRNEVLRMEQESDWLLVVTAVQGELQALIPCHGTSINLVDPGGGATIYYHFDGQVQALTRVQVPAAVRAAMESGRTLYRRTRAEIERFDPGMHPSVRCVVDVPIGECGTVAANSLKENAFTADDLEILQQVAEVVGEGVRRLADLRALAGREEELEQSRHQELVGQLAAGVAHEINNPLTSVLGYAQLLLRRDLPPEERGYAETILAEGRRAHGIAERLLAYTRARGGDWVTIALGDLAASVVQLVRYQYEAEGVAIRTDLAAGLPLRPLQAAALQQLLLVLLDNSRRALRRNGRHGGAIHVSTSGDAQHLRLVVADDGPGVSAAIRDRIFDPFFTTDPASHEAGLGLSLARRIAADHGGTLRCAEVAAGACFVLELPAAAPT